MGHNDSSNSTGFVYCCQHMENEAEAQQAIRSLNGHILNGNRINVEVNWHSVSLAYSI